MTNQDIGNYVVLPRIVVSVIWRRSNFLWKVSNLSEKCVQPRMCCEGILPGKDLDRSTVVVCLLFVLFPIRLCQSVATVALAVAHSDICGGDEVH